MKTFVAYIFAIACMAIGSLAHAGLIQYTYNSPIHNASGAHDAAALITVDDDLRRLVSVSFASEPFTFDWLGSVELMYPQPAEDVGGLYVNGFKSFTHEDIELSLYFDYFYLEAGEDIFHNLHKTHPYEGAFIRNVTNNETLWFSGMFTKVSPAVLHESSTLMLLCLGLMALIIARSRGLLWGLR
jgi:hypothetical protein